MRTPQKRQEVKPTASVLQDYVVDGIQVGEVIVDETNRQVGK